MSKYRFEVLESAIQFCEVDRRDSWWPIRKLLDRFNEHTKVVFAVGKWASIGESGFWWLGKDRQWHHDDMTHVTKIIRKPRIVMAELKSLCDALSGAMIAVELQEGKDAMKTKEFASAPHNFPHHAALDLCLTKIADCVNREVCLRVTAPSQVRMLFGVSINMDFSFGES